MESHLADKLKKTYAKHQWETIGVHHHHGICTPLFSLHSEKSCGIGEYFDLIPMIWWCKEIGMDVIQLLPLNDSGLDTSPYNSLSAFALNPIHLSLSALPELNSISEYEEKLAKMRQWNRSNRVRYNIVRELKYVFFRDYFSSVFPILSKTDSYRDFVKNNKWLESYSLFKSLKENQMWKTWEQWPTHLKSPSKKSYEELLHTYHNQCQLHTFLQYLCYQQLGEVKRIASEHGVFLKGDVPFLISRDSAEVWHYRHFFLLHLAAGAPPDMYARDGQYWGFPIYDWEEIEKDNYNWWRERLQLASHLYHLYRIDHVVGFFRIWAILLDKSAKEGFFIPENEESWIPQGRKLMELMLKTASILPIGEDLGIVPPNIKQCLYDLGICGTKVIRWERRWEVDGSFIPIEEYPPMTMTTVSTHDSDTLQLWWRHYPKEARLYSKFKNWNYKPFLSSERHKQILRDSHHSASLFHINLLQEYLALFPEFVSKNPNKERINIPGKILDTNWTYRFHPTIETIVQHPLLKQTMLDILKSK